MAVALGVYVAGGASGKFVIVTVEIMLVFYSWFW